MSSSEVYHIYLKDSCIFPCLTKEKFKTNWECLNMMVGFMKTDYVVEDLSYEVVKPLQSNEEQSY